MKPIGITLVTMLLQCYTLCGSSTVPEEPLIPEIVEPETPGIVAYWEIMTLLSRPGRLTGTTDRRAEQSRMPMKHFYAKLKALRDDPKLKEGWRCASQVRLTPRHARDIARKVATKDDLERVTGILQSHSQSHDDDDGDRLASMRDIRLFESIKRHHPNYNPSLVELARKRIDEVSEACPGLQSGMKELGKTLTLRSEDIKEDNAVSSLVEGVYPEKDPAPLIAMTVIGVVSVLLNVVQGFIAARHGYDKIASVQGGHASPPCRSVS